jgi:hypothetical protein
LPPSSSLSDDPVQGGGVDVAAVPCQAARHQRLHIGVVDVGPDRSRLLGAGQEVAQPAPAPNACVHPVVGEITVIYETMQLNTDEGPTMAVNTTEPGSASQQALDILASWSATSDQANTASATDQP